MSRKFWLFSVKIKSATMEKQKGFVSNNKMTREQATFWKINQPRRGCIARFGVPIFRWRSNGDTFPRPPQAGANANADKTGSDAAGIGQPKRKTRSFFPRRPGRQNNVKNKKGLLAESDAFVPKDP